MHWMGANLWAVLAAAVACMSIGFVWYSPALSARPWMVAMGMDPDNKAAIQEMQKGTGKLYGIAFVTSLVSAFVLAKVLRAMGISSPLRGMKVAFAVWLGFVATVQLTVTLFGKKSPRLFGIDTGYQFVCYQVMGIILAAWR